MDGRLTVSIALFLLGGALSSGALASVPPISQVPPTVRVLVERSSTSLQVDGYDVILSPVQAGARQSYRYPRRAALSFQCGVGANVKVYDGAGNQRVLTAPLRLVSPGGFLRANGKQFRQELHIYSDSGACLVVNHVDIEKYVAGLLNSEMSAAWSLEALKAQAVAARTYAIHRMRELSGLRARADAAPFDLDSSERDQVYEGAHKERLRAIEAVNQTKGMVLMFNGAPVKAFYHSTCGGQTISAKKVWGKEAEYITPVRCGYCQSSPRYKWTYQVSRRALEGILGAAGYVRGRLDFLRAH
jgi:stage II sporulation protein D